MVAGQAARNETARRTAERRNPPLQRRAARLARVRQGRLWAEPAIWSVAVVIPGLEDLHLFVVGAVHEPVFVVDAAGPVAGQVTLQGFRLTYPGERVALDLTDQARDPHRHLPIC